MAVFVIIAGNQLNGIGGVDEGVNLMRSPASASLSPFKGFETGIIHTGFHLFFLVIRQKTKRNATIFLPVSYLQMLMTF